MAPTAVLEKYTQIRQGFDSLIHERVRLPLRLRLLAMTRVLALAIASEAKQSPDNF
jgi:hypothetical protein